MPSTLRAFTLLFTARNFYIIINLLQREEVKKKNRAKRRFWSRDVFKQRLDDGPNILIELEGNDQGWAKEVLPL